MKKIMHWLIVMFIPLFSFTFTSCNDDDDKDEPTPPTVQENPLLSKLVGKWECDQDFTIEITSNYIFKQTLDGKNWFSCKFTLDGNTIRLSGDVPAIDEWGSTYTITFTSNNKMTWVSPQMSGYDESWYYHFTKK